MTKPARGRLFFANPGPTNIPDSILKAISHHTVDFMDAPFMELYEGCVAGLKRVLQTKQHLFFYTASGHGAWEASLVNLLSPGDLILVIETGNFSESWARMAEGLGSARADGGRRLATRRRPRDGARRPGRRLRA